MKYRAHIEVEFETDEDCGDHVATEYAFAVEDLPGVIEAWVANLEEAEDG